MGQRKLYLQYYLDYCHYMWRRRLIAGILVCLAMYWYRINTRKKKRAITYAPMLDRDVERLRRLDRLYHGTEAHCISELRMWKVVFHKLCAELRSRALLEDTVHVTIEEQVAMFIHVVGHNWSNRPIAFEFMRSGETVSRYFNIVLNALCILARNLICIRSVDTHPKITSSHGRFHPYSQGCIGALDGTHIPACVPIHMQDRFRGRKSFTSQNVLAAVDFDLRFLYVLAGWEGSAHDSYVLQDALSRPNGLKIPEAMTKRKVKVDAFASSRERSLTWHEDQTKFMLEWYMEYLKKQYAGFKIKKTHHMLCADGLNKKFAMGVTADQVDRHYRYHKENWKFIAATLSKSGNTFDHTRCLVTISESQKATLCDRARRLLSKPIKFFNEIQELFTRASADGSLAMDQNTCMDVSDGSDSDDSKDLLDLNCYTQPEDTIGEDSDTLPTPTTNATLDNNSSSTSRACKKRPRGSKSPIKKPSKKKSLFAESTNEISAMMKSLQETLAATAPPQMPQFTDPHAVLWQKLEAIPLIPDQRVLVGDYLSSKENKSKRGWLCNASDYTLHAWVFKFLC